MAKTVIAAEFTLNSSGAEGSVKSLKAQLREAQAEVSKMSDKFGETSTQAANAARKAAELKDRIGDAKALTDAFNPDKKFQAFSTAIQGVVGGFTALQGAQALFGVKSEELEKTLLKVQGAMALSQGLSAITESIDAFKNLKTVALATFNSIRAAIGSTGVGLLVVAIGAVVSAMMEYVNQSSEVEQATKRMKEEEDKYKKSLEETTKEIENRNKLTEYQLQLDLSNAKARGASLKELRKIESDYWYQKRLDAQTDLENTISENEKLKSQYTDKSEILQASNKDLEAKRQAYYTINQNYNLAIAKQNEEDYLKQKELDKKKKEESEQLRKARESGEMLLLETIERTLQEQEEARSEAFDDEFLDYLDRQMMLEEAAKEELLLYQSTIDLKNELDEQRFKNQQELAEKTSEIFTQFSAIVGKETVAGKALGIAAATMDTYIAANKALKADYSVFGPAAQVARIASVAATIGIGIKNVREIAKVKVPGGGGANVPSGVSGLSAPIGTQMGATALQQAQINAAGNAAVQAFVLESDVSGNQERIERLNRAARIQ